MSRLANAVRFGAGGVCAVGVTNSDASMQAAGKAMELFKAPRLAELFAHTFAQSSARSTQVAAASQDTAAVLAALQTATQALQAMAQAQQRSGTGWSRVALWMAVPLAGALAIHHFGWARIGWVSGEQLSIGLQKVRDYVGTRIVELGDALTARLQALEASLRDTTEAVHEVSATTAEVKLQVSNVAASLASMEQRMTPLESNAATAAHGVEVLCELVKTSGLLSNASADSLRRLDHFTGALTPTRPAELEVAPARPELMAPPPAELPSPPSMPAPQLRVDMPAFVRALVTP